jgi:hypothetical protein
VKVQEQEKVWGRGRRDSGPFPPDPLLGAHLAGGAGVNVPSSRSTDELLKNRQKREFVRLSAA